MLTCTLDKLLYHLCSQFVTHPHSCYLICSSILLASMQPDLLEYTLLAPCNIFRMTSEFTISNLLAYCTLLLLKVSLQYFFFSRFTLKSYIYCTVQTKTKQLCATCCQFINYSTADQIQCIHTSTHHLHRHNRH